MSSWGRRRSGRVGYAASTSGRLSGVQEVLADEASDETRDAAKAEPPGK